MLLAALFICLWSFSQCGIVEGFLTRFSRNDPVDVLIRKVSSSAGLPYDFYELPVCRPAEIETSMTSIGEYFFGDRVQNSVFDIRVLQDVPCRRIEAGPGILCPEANEETLSDLIDKIRNLYVVEMEIDNLPGADLTIPGRCGYYTPYAPTLSDPIYRSPSGFFLGCMLEPTDEAVAVDEDAEGDVIVNNHWTFNIKYNRNEDDDKISIVAFEVLPSSIAHTETTCQFSKEIPSEAAGAYVVFDSDTQAKVKQGQSLSIPWSYSVHWEESPIIWSMRWDNYIHAEEGSNDRNTHLFAVINSILVVVFLSGCVGFIMLSILRKDILTINSAADQAEVDALLEETTGWKAVHDQVFRPPRFLMLFSICLGSGIQILATLLIALAGGLVGVLSPANRGGLMTGAVIVCAFMGLLAGFYALKFYRKSGGERWRTTAFLTAFFFPGLLFFCLALSNFIFKVATSSTIAVPFLTLLSLFGLWLGIYVPLTFIGGYFGFRKEPSPYPTKQKMVPRPVPQQPWYLSPLLSILFGGVLPFGAIFIELYFVFSSLWLNQFYYLFGFLFVVFIILIVTTSEISIVLTYFQLCNQDYNWWWRSFLASGSSALYLFAYTVVYYFATLRVPSPLLGIVYYGYMTIVCLAFFFMTGTIGFVASLWFVNKIYSSVRLD